MALGHRLVLVLAPVRRAAPGDPPAWPRRYRRSDVYRKLVAFDRRHGLTAALDARRGQPPREAVIQDVEIPLERGAEFLRVLRRRGRHEPGVAVPAAAARRPAWPLYPLQPGEVYVNFGFWGTVPLPPGQPRRATTTG